MRLRYEMQTIHSWNMSRWRGFFLFAGWQCCLRLTTRLRLNDACCAVGSWVIVDSTRGGIIYPACSSLLTELPRQRSLRCFERHVQKKFTNSFCQRGKTSPEYPSQYLNKTATALKRCTLGGRHQPTALMIWSQHLSQEIGSFFSENEASRLFFTKWYIRTEVISYM